MSQAVRRAARRRAARATWALPALALNLLLSLPVNLPRASAAPGAPAKAPARPAPADGQGGKLTLADVLRALDQHYPLVLAARQDVGAASAEVEAARGAFDPVFRTRIAGAPLGYYQNFRLETGLEVPTPLWGLSLSGGYRLGLGKFAVYDGKLETTDLGEVRAGLTLPLWRNGPTDRRRANIRRAELGVDAAQSGLQEQLLQLRRAGAHRFWEWVAAGRRRGIAQELLQIAVTRDSALAARVNGGDLPAVERTDNRRAVVQREGLMVSAERALKQAAIELSLYLRDEGGDPVEPDPSQAPPLPEPTAPDPGRLRADIEGALQRRPELVRLQAQRRQQEIERDWARNQRAPAVDVSAMVAHDIGPGPERLKPTQIEAGVLIDIPILNRAADGRRKVAEAGVSRVAAQARLMRDRIAAEVTDAHSAVQTAHERVGLARRELGLSRELERAERTKFTLGDSTLLFVNLREQQAAEAALREVDALLDYHRARATYEAVLAVR